MKNTVFIFCLILSIFSVALLPTSTAHASAEVLPQFHFKTLKTPHFEIIYHDTDLDVANLYAEKLEAAYLYLSKIFLDRPEKTIVVINDRTDVTNGYATRLPYPHIMAFPVMPGASDLVFEYNDWTLELLGHEYTHILTFEPAGGVMAPLRKIFGNVIAPNMLLPTWWKEGIAVEMETSMNSYGRSMSTYQDAVIRAFVSHNRLFQYDLARANEVLPVWPFGSTPYLFGSLFFSGVNLSKEPEALGRLTKRQGERVPYWITAPAEEILGVNYNSLYMQTLFETQERAKTQINLLKTVSPTSFEQLKLTHHPQASNPVISPDGKNLAVIATDTSLDRKILIFKKSNQDFDLNPKIEKTRPDFLSQNNEGALLVDHERLTQNQDPHENPPDGSIQKILWSADSQFLYYNKIDSNSSIESYSDLYRYNISTQKSEKLSDRLRAREPALSPSQKQIVFIKLGAARTDLALFDLTSKKVSILLHPELQVRLSSPLFINENEIVFSRKEAVGGQDSLYVINIETQIIRPVLSSYENAQAQNLSSHGLIFTSLANGTRNLYLADATLNMAQPISHTISAITTGSIDESTQNIWATQISAQGPEVVKFPFQEIPVKLPVISPLWADQHPRPANLVSTNANPFTTTTEDYEPTQYLWPTFWIPFVASSSSGEGLNLSLQTFNHDPLKKHAYSVNLSYNTALNKGTLLGVYENNTSNLGFGLSSAQENTYFGTTDNIISSTENSIYFIPDVFKISKYLAVQLGATQTDKGLNGVSHQGLAPFAKAIYTTASQSGQQISPESGLTATLDLRNEFSIRNTTPHEEISSGITIYESRFLPHRHALMAHAGSFIIPRTVPFSYGVVSTGSAPSEGSLQTFALRGSANGQFLGRKMNNLNVEYRFPLRDIYKGSGTDPFFIDRMTGAFTADLLDVEGLGYDINKKSYQRLDLGSPFGSIGLEARLELKIGYFLPLHFIYGYYLPTKTELGLKATPGLQIQMGGVF